MNKKLKKDELGIRKIILDLDESLIDTTSQIIRVVWEDANTLIGSSDYSTIKGLGLAKAETIGRLIYEDEKRIAICGFLFPDENHSLQDPIQDTIFRDVHVIPKVAIKHVAVLKTDWEDTKKFRENNKDWFKIFPEENQGGGR